jgi:hypothetical protein
VLEMRRVAKVKNELLPKNECLLYLDTCLGDSGGPLMKFSLSKQWVLAGVISSGRGCGLAEYAGLYTRVAFYSKWINAIIGTDDLFNDPVLTADDSIFNICSRYHPSSLLFIVISICLSRWFM